MPPPVDGRPWRWRRCGCASTNGGSPRMAPEQPERGRPRRGGRCDGDVRRGDVCCARWREDLGRHAGSSAHLSALRRRAGRRIRRRRRLLARGYCVACASRRRSVRCALRVVADTAVDTAILPAHRHGDRSHRRHLRWRAPRPPGCPPPSDGARARERADERSRHVRAASARSRGTRRRRAPFSPSGKSRRPRYSPRARSTIAWSFPSPPTLARYGAGSSSSSASSTAGF